MNANPVTPSAVSPSRSATSLARAAALALLTVGLFGCPPPSVSANLTVWPQQACPGATVQVSWSVDPSAAVTVTLPTGLVLTGTSGTQTFSATTSGTVSLSASRSGYSSTQRSLSVDVVSGPRTVSLGGPASCGLVNTLYYSGSVYGVQAVSDQSNADGRLKVDSISRLWGDSRNYDIAHAGLRVALPSGTAATTAFSGQSLSGTWVVTSPLEDDEYSCVLGTDPRYHAWPSVIAVNAQVSCH